jgi:molecular chaperone GrpE (heat shock protein)
MIIKPHSTPHQIVSKQDLFNKVLQSTDFKPAKNSLEAVKIMFNALFPTIERVIHDNESLLTDNAKTLKNFAELDEAYKTLKEEYENLRKRLQEEAPEEAQ